MTADTALSLDGTGRLDYSLKTGPKRDALLRQALQGGPSNSNPTGPSSLEVKFRTRSKSGTLLHVQESSNYTTVKVQEHESRAWVWVSKTKVGLNVCAHNLCNITCISLFFIQWNSNMNNEPALSQ